VRVAIAALHGLAAALVATIACGQPAPAPGDGTLTSPSPGVAVLTIDTRDTGVDLGLHPHDAGVDEHRAAAAHPGGQAADATDAGITANGGTADGSASPPPTSTGVPAAPLPDRGSGSAEAPSGTPVPALAPAMGADALDAPLSATRMRLDAVTAAAAAEASRNHNGTLVEGRIGAPR